MAIVQGEHLEAVMFDRCFHIAGRGGAKAATWKVFANVSPDKFVIKMERISRFYEQDATLLCMGQCV